MLPRGRRERVCHLVSWVKKASLKEGLATALQAKVTGSWNTSRPSTPQPRLETWRCCSNGPKQEPGPGPGTCPSSELPAVQNGKARESQGDKPWWPPGVGMTVRLWLFGAGPTRLILTDPADSSHGLGIPSPPPPRATTTAPLQGGTTKFLSSKSFLIAKPAFQPHP